MGTSKRGILWKLLNSLWVIWSFIPMLNWVGFFHIGRRARQKRWILFGWLYLVLCLILPLTAIYLKEKAPTMYDITTTIAAIGWISSIGHSFLCLGKYVKLRDAILDRQDSYFIPENSNSTTQYHNFPQPQTQPKVFTNPISNQQPIDNPINLNSCSEKQLANLPGVGVALSKKAIKIRNEIGEFTSVDDFNKRLGLKPHFAVQIKNLAYTAPVKRGKSAPQNNGRMVDI